MLQPMAVAVRKPPRFHKQSIPSIPNAKLATATSYWKGFPAAQANRRCNGNGAQRVPGKTDQSAQPDGEYKEIEQQHLRDSPFCARLLLNRNGNNTENQSDCREDDEYHGVPPFPLKGITRPPPAVFQIARITLVGVF